MAPSVRVLVVDDSAVVRRVVSDVLEQQGDIEVVATASNGRLALERLDRLEVDVVVLDIEMPVLDGLSTLPELRARWPRLPVIMFSTLTERGAAATLDALSLGATDYVTKPSRMSDRRSVEVSIIEGLVPLLRTWGRADRPGAAGPGDEPGPEPAASGQDAGALDAPSAPALRPPARRRSAAAVVVASSTGGPNALSAIVPALPGSLGVPVLVVQHMPPLFTRLLAERLDQRSALAVTEGHGGAVVRPGVVYVARGGIHMTVRRRDGEVVIADDDGAPEHSVKPAADVLFRSAVDVWGDGLLAVVLTGMGNDGMAGARAVVSADGSVIAQDEATSVVWGMPGAVCRAGLAHEVVPLEGVVDAILRHLRRSAETVAAR